MCSTPDLFKLQSVPFLIQTWTCTLASYCKKWSLEQLYLTWGESEAGCEYWGQDKPISFMPGGIRMPLNSSANYRPAANAALSTPGHARGARSPSR